ncbi:MAG: hypothetical protein WCA38_05400 [Candidatus Acidiferrales bacterium]
MGDDLDRQARALHEHHVRGTSADPKVFTWDAIDDDLLDSNRQAADHIPVKLRAIGCHAVRKGEDDPGTPVTKFTPDEVELLAKMEHRRWMAERFLAGWCPGAKDIENRTSPYLVEWDELKKLEPKNVQDYDRDLVSILPRVLELAGSEIRR